MKQNQMKNETITKLLSLANNYKKNTSMNIHMLP